MEMEMMEDDLLFADLSKQISLLIMDEDDGDVALSHPWYPYLHQDMSYVMGNTPSIQGQGQGQQPRNVQEEKREMSKGTGVFIPKFAQPRRRRTTSFNHHPSRHTTSYNANNSYSRPNDHHHYRHQHLDDYYTTRRFTREGSKVNYFINPDKI